MVFYGLALRLTACSWVPLQNYGTQHVCSWFHPRTLAALVHASDHSRSSRWYTAFDDALLVIAQVSNCISKIKQPHIKLTFFLVNKSALRSTLWSSQNSDVVVSSALLSSTSFSVLLWLPWLLDQFMVANQSQILWPASCLTLRTSDCYSQTTKTTTTRTEPSKLVQARQTIPALAEKWQQPQARVLISLARSNYFDHTDMHFI